jgi:predicted Zn finger-like uncharacterized protein
MKITCPTCNSIYNLPDEKISQTQTTVTCKKCNGKIGVLDRTKVINSYPPAVPAKALPSLTKQPEKSASPTNPLPGSFLSILYGEWPELRTIDSAKFDLKELLLPRKFKTRQNKQKVKLMHAIQPILSKLLEKDEKIYKIAKGYSICNIPDVIELLRSMGGLIGMLIFMKHNPSAVIATDRRLLMISLNFSVTRPARYIFQFPYAMIEKISVSPWKTSLIIQSYHDQKFRFRGIDSDLWDQLLYFIQPKIRTNSPLNSRKILLTNLCPSCYTAIASDIEACPKCQSMFKSVAIATFFSIFPGFGHIYLGYFYRGLLEAFFIFGYLMLYLFTHMPRQSKSGLLIFFLTVYAISIYDTFANAKKGPISQK